jgi:hypothetical protein
LFVNYFRGRIHLFVKYFSWKDTPVF